MDVKLRETGGKTVWYTALVSIYEYFRAGCVFSVWLAVRLDRSRGQLAVTARLQTCLQAVIPSRVMSFWESMVVALSLDRGLELLDLRSLKTCCSL